MITTLLIVLLAVLALLAYAATKPNAFRIERSAQIAASPEQIFPLLNDLHRWREWSPWEELDPGMSRTHSGAQQGVGAVYEWDGNRKAGAGRMEIQAAEPPTRLEIELRFLRPFKATNTAAFTLTAKDGGTHINWALTGQNALFNKVLSIVINIEKLVGKDFEKGLAKLKQVSEA